MRTKMMLMSALLAILAASASASVVVYEGFEYSPEGTAITGLGTAVDGWAGAWTTVWTNSNVIHEIDPGLSLGGLPVSGGSVQRPTRSGTSAMNRQISVAAQDALTTDNTTIWFSVLMNPGDDDPVAYPVNSYATLIFGDAELTGGSGTSAAPIAAGGNAIGVGYAGGPGPGTYGNWENMRIQGVTYKDGAYTENTAQRTVAGASTVMIVGKMDWAPNGTDDIVSLYLLDDPAGPVPAPFSTMAVDLDQTAFNVVGMGDGQRSVFDEIRFGFSYDEVTYAPTPKNGQYIPLTNPLTLSWVNLDPNDPADSVYVDVWFGTEPNELNPLYDMTKVVNAGQDVTTYNNVDASVEDTYYWRVDSYLYGDPGVVDYTLPSEPNKITGTLYSFVAVDDTPPSIASVTPAQMTWSGEPVPLTATVADDGKSAVTILWTADAVSLADPNLTIDIADSGTETPTVTIAKDTDGLGLKTVTMTVSVWDELNTTPVTATVEIDVYDDACQMARQGEGKNRIEGAAFVTDFDHNCVTNLLDLVQMAEVWLGDYSATGPADL